MVQFSTGGLVWRGFDLMSFEWSVIEPLLPTKVRGVERVDHRWVLNGTFWRLRQERPEPRSARATGLIFVREPLQSLTAGWALGAEFGTRVSSLRGRRADDRRLIHTGSPARRKRQ